MGIVSEELSKIVAAHIHQHGVVVWYDPERQYEFIVDELKIEGCTIVKYEGSFFAVRNLTDPLLIDDNAPRLLIYVPMDQAFTHRALAELELLGVVLRPGHPQPEFNTRLSYVASTVLRPILGIETSTALEKQIDEGKLSLHNVDELASKGAGIGKGIISVIYGTSNVQEIALIFLASDRLDSELIQKNAIAEIILLLTNEYDILLDADKQPKEIRKSLSRHILATDYLLGCFKIVPPDFKSFKLPINSASRTSCIDIARTWRMRRDLQSSYIASANEIALQLKVSSVDIWLEEAGRCETFRCIDDKLRSIVAKTILSNPESSIVDLIATRQQGFWSAALPEYQSRWAFLASLAKLKSEISRISKEFNSVKLNAPAIAQRYVDANMPWCAIDTLHRNVERMYNALDIDESDRGLEKLFTDVREQYYKLSSRISEQFVAGLSDSKFQLPSIIKQIEIFNKRVKPALDEAKIAYIWVDALRYEMGLELAASLRDDYEVITEAAIASVPTITEIGMSSLLPITDQRLSIVPIGEGKLALQIDDKIIKDRKARIDYFRAQFPTAESVCAAKLEELLPRPKKKLREEIVKSRVVLITSQEIDELCESDNVSLARRAMQDILHELKRAIKVLQELGVTQYFVVADHGHIFGEELSPDMLIDAPGGETKDLHRRVWLGNGGSMNSAVLRASLKSFSYESELEIAVPLSLGGFKVAGGAKNYFHGGMSLQELLIPVINIKPMKGLKRVAGDVVLQLKPGSNRITTRFYSVQITGGVSTFMDAQPPVVRVEVRAGSESISTPISASYGYEDATGEVRLRFEQQNPQNVEPNTITLQIESVNDAKTVSLHLFDSNGVELSRLDDIEYAISI